MSKHTETHDLRTETHGVRSDTISRQDTIEAIEHVTWYHQNRNGQMVSGANSDEHQAWYKAEDVYEAIEAVGCAEPNVIRCKDCIWWGRTITYKDGTTMTDCKKGLSSSADGYCYLAERRRQ